MKLKKLNNRMEFA